MSKRYTFQKDANFMKMGVNDEEPLLSAMLTLTAAYKGGTLPDFNTADGPYITTGFRPQLSTAQCFCSMFSWHNQTINIWTSLVLMIFNIWMCAQFTEESGMSRDILTLFWLHGILRAICWMNSWGYHTFVCSSKENARLLCTMDYIGCYLTPLGMGSNVVFIELYCHPSMASLFLSIGFICVVGAIYTALTPLYQTERFRSLRFALSVGSMVPYITGLIVAVCTVHDFRVPEYYNYLFIAFIWEILGAFFYTTMLPEIKYPKYFDSHLSSHNLWHWCNFGFDFFMMYFTYQAFMNLKATGYCNPH